jgi:hypothetical protein
MAAPNPADTVKYLLIFLESEYEASGGGSDEDRSRTAPNPNDNAYRVAEGRFIRVGQSYDALVAGIGAYVAYTSTTGLVPLLVAYTGLSAAVIIRSFLNCYVNLGSPELVEVYEAVFALQGRYAKYHWTGRRTTPGFGPTFEKLEEYLGNYSSEELRHILGRLTDQKAIVFDDGRWSVSFF